MVAFAVVVVAGIIVEVVGVDVLFSAGVSAVVFVVVVFDDERGGGGEGVSS